MSQCPNVLPLLNVIGIIMSSRTSCHCCLYIFVIITIACAANTPDGDFRGVLGAPINLPCPAGDGVDIETVNWYFNYSSTETLLVSYFPSEHYYKFQRGGYAIYDDKHLSIAYLSTGDSGTFRCNILSSTSIEFYSKVHVTILDGCQLPSYSNPLYTGNSVCLAGKILPYAFECTFRCPEYYLLSGNNSVSCTANGELSGELPYCEALPQCTIPTFGPPLISSDGCATGSTIVSGFQCIFQCPPQYILHGNATLTCQLDGKLDLKLPSCAEIEKVMSQQMILGLIFGISIPLMLCISILVHCWIRHSKGRHSRLGRHDRLKMKSSMAQYREDQQKTFNMWIESWIRLLEDQLPEPGSAEYMQVTSKILRRVKDMENNFFLRLTSLDKSLFEDIQHFVDKIDMAGEDTQKAFATYCFVLTSYVGDQMKRDTEGNRLIALSGSEREDRSHSSVKSQSDSVITNDSHSSEKRSDSGLAIDEFIKENGETFAKYLTSVHKVLQHMLAAERISITDERSRRERTARVCAKIATMKRSISASQELELSNSSLSFRSNEEKHQSSYRFAELCVKKLNNVPSMQDRVRWRQDILEQFFQ